MGAQSPKTWLRYVAGSSPQNSVSGLHPTGYCQGRQLGQPTLTQADQRPLLSPDCAQSRGPLGQPVRAKRPQPALSLATPPHPGPPLPGLRLPLHSGLAPVNLTHPFPLPNSQTSSVHTQTRGHTDHSFIHSFIHSFSKRCLTRSVPGRCSASRHRPLSGQHGGREEEGALPWTLKGETDGPLDLGIQE